jgi:lipoate-protein ligase A
LCYTAGIGGKILDTTEETMSSKEKRAPESIVREIKRRPRRKFTPEEKIRIVLEGFQGRLILKKDGIDNGAHFLGIQ